MLCESTAGLLSSATNLLPGKYISDTFLRLITSAYVISEGFHAEEKFPDSKLPSVKSLCVAYGLERYERNNDVRIMVLNILTTLVII